MTNQFTWVPFYEELANKVLAYKNDRQALISKIKEAHVSAGVKLPKIEADNDNIPDIDPFTVFALFNRGNQSTDTRKALCHGYKSVFGIDADVPQDFDGIPMQNYTLYCFYCYLGDPNRDNNCFEILWTLLEEAIRCSNGADNEAAFADCFEKALKLRGVGLSKMTIGMFQVSPNYFISLDSTNVMFIENELKENTDIQNGNDYLKLCDKIRDYVKTNAECHSLPGFSYLAHTYRTQGQTALYYSDWRPTIEEYDPNISKEQWLDFMNNSGLFNDNYKQFLSAMLDNGGQATCSQLSKKYGNTAAHYIMEAVHLAEQVTTYTGRPLYKNEEGNDCRWAALFVGKNASAEESGSFIWKMRDELKEALESMDLSNLKPVNVKKQKNDIALNTILYGPPGTGKTYSTVIYAVAIIENKSYNSVKTELYENVRERYKQYKDEGLIEFTTFHQSYGYEEFIEGIKPETKNDEVTYEVKPGVFKAFCENDINKSGTNIFEQSWQKLVAEIYSSGNKPYIFTREKTGSPVKAVLYNDDTFRVYWESEQNSYNSLFKDTIKEQWEGKIDREELKGGSIWAFDARQAVISELKKKYGLGEYKKELVDKRNKVFIIDEINRGNISKIFGELITLIEPTKRIGQEEETYAKLPYSQESFGVPDNIYLLGTMNTADRSIAAIDTALRRRFEFKEMQPEHELLLNTFVKDENGNNAVNVGRMLEKINSRIKILFDREHTVGHSFFMGLKDRTNLMADDLKPIFEKNIIPLLQEYFYDDYEKIRLVLGDNNKTNTADQFIIATDVDYSDLFGDADLGMDENMNYEINSDAFSNIEAYRKI